MKPSTQDVLCLYFSDVFEENQDGTLRWRGRGIPQISALERWGVSNINMNELCLNVR